MREMTLAVPPRRTRRYTPARDGKRPDLRRTLRLARRSGGEAIRLAARAPRLKPRRLIVLCDISGSMEPYARALLLLLYCINGGQVRGGQNRPEVFKLRHSAHPADAGDGRGQPGHAAGQGGGGGA
jgi:uncharacterized protein with von Willebrand factor type A (vWA) domain